MVFFIFRWLKKAKEEYFTTYMGFRLQSPRVVLMKQATCIPLHTTYGCCFATKTE